MNLRTALRPLARSAKRSAFLLGLVAAGLAGPALAEDAPQPGDSDPWESFNRPVFWFNDQIDTYFLAPVATGWDWVTPDPVQGWIENFFHNLDVPIVTVNALLQGKPAEAGKGLARFLINSTVGFAGFFDPAGQELNLPRVREDFGQTLAVWGVGAGPYLVLPFLGPSTPRDAVGTGVDGALAIYPWFVPFAYVYSTRALDLVNSRAQVLEQVAASRKSSLDYYVFVRNAFLQYRRALIEDRATSPKGGLYEDLYDVVPGNN